MIRIKNIEEAEKILDEAIKKIREQQAELQSAFMHLLDKLVGNQSQIAAKLSNLFPGSTLKFESGNISFATSDGKMLQVCLPTNAMVRPLNLQFFYFKNQGTRPSLLKEFPISTPIETLLSWIEGEMPGVLG